MIKKRYTLAALGVTSVLLGSLFYSVAMSASTGGEYDAWMDLNDDGVVDAIDLQLLALIYGSFGTPINKTELLLELEARINALNASLLADYYTRIDCDNLFAPLRHTHSGSDISGGTLNVDQIRIQRTEGDGFIYFYEDGSPTGEYIYWDDASDQFCLSDDTRIEGTIAIPTTTRYYSIPTVAWRPSNSSVDFRIVVGGTILWTLTSGDVSFFAPVYLPHGAVVTEFRAWLYDNAMIADFDVYLFRQAEKVTEQMASVTTSGHSTDVVQYYDSSIDYPTVDNQNYAYFVCGILNADFQELGQMRITYTIDEPLP